MYEEYEDSEKFLGDFEDEFAGAYVDDAEHPYFDVTKLSDKAYGAWKSRAPGHADANLERQRYCENRGPRPAYQDPEIYEQMTKSDADREMRGRAELRNSGKSSNPGMFMREEDL